VESFHKQYEYKQRVMKKKTIWTIAIIMGLSFLGLLLLQLNYIEEMAEMKKEQFDESVNRALYQASRNMELNETLRYLEDDVNKKERSQDDEQSADKDTSTAAHQAPSTDNQGDVYTSFEAKLKQSKPSFYGVIVVLCLLQNVICKRLFVIVMSIRKLC